MITWKNIHVHDQCFCKTAPLWESRVAIREGPQRNGKRANLALYFYKATGLHRYSILIAIPGLKITIDTVANATKMSFSKAKNSGLVAIIATPLSTLTIKNGYFRTPYVLLENHIERLLLLKHRTEKKSIHLFAFLYWFSNIGKLPNCWPCLKSLYNALQTLDHWLRHVCLCIVLSAPFLKNLAPKTSLQGPL